MHISQVNEPALQKPLRLWPGVAAVTLQWLFWLVIPFFSPADAGLGVIGGFFGGVIILLWWLFFSRAAWSERLAAIVLMVVAAATTSRHVHESISNGMMGFMFLVYSIPVLSLALVTWTVASRGFSNSARRASLVAAILIACGTLTLIRTNGINGDAASDLQWRWTPTPEERLLTRAVTEPAVVPAAPAAVAATPVQAVAETAALRVPKNPETTAPAPAETDATAGWPGFRGSERDSVIPGALIETDWSRLPPIEMWRRPIGPGWSSFAVHGDRIFTQEQLGGDEIVSAYNLNTGVPVWKHSDAARFWESNAGPGPRATPTLSNDRVYTLGATGILNALDARDGSVIWSRNAATDTGRKVPDWGIASSPLVVGNVVIAATAGSLAAYEIGSGKPRWFGPKDGWGYSSPQLSTIAGVPQVVLVNGAGVISVAPFDGTLFWKHDWPNDGIVQAGVTAGGDLLIGSGSGLAANTGMRRVTVAHEPGGWTVQERWTSAGLKPYFNDFVVHAGHVFGFDGSILACIDLNDGTRKWKGGRYGHGQLILLPDQDLLLVLSEDGELALVKAAADKFTELARFPAIEGKTWNHPVLVGDILLVRNGEEMAAFRLPVASR